VIACELAGQCARSLGPHHLLLIGKFAETPFIYNGTFGSHPFSTLAQKIIASVHPAVYAPNDLPFVAIIKRM